MKARDRRIRDEALRSVRCPDCNKQRLARQGALVLCAACGWWGAPPQEVLETEARIHQRKARETQRNAERHAEKLRQSA